MFHISYSPKYSVKEILLKMINKVPKCHCRGGLYDK